MANLIDKIGKEAAEGIAKMLGAAGISPVWVVSGDDGPVFTYTEAGTQNGWQPRLEEELHHALVSCHENSDKEVFANIPGYGGIYQQPIIMTEHHVGSVISSVSEESATQEKNIKLVDNMLCFLQETYAKNEKTTPDNIFETAINSLKLAIHIINKDKEIIFANDELKRQTLFLINNNENPVGKRVSELYPLTLEKQQKIDNDYEYVFFSGKSIVSEDSNYFSGRINITRTTKNPIYLNGEVVQIVTMIEDITQEKLAEKKLRENEEKFRFLSVRDALTGLYNRNYFESEMRRYDEELIAPVVIIVGDTNGLKLVNDAFGNDIGDQFLMKCAEIFSAFCPHDGLCARIDGDEFVLLLPGGNVKDAEQTASLIKQSGERYTMEAVSLSISVGFAVRENIDENIFTVYRKAEDNMQNNKLLENKSIRGSIINSLIQTLHERTHETEAHSMRMREYSIKLGRKLGLAGADLDRLELLATLHDIGKVAVPENVLDKQGCLDDDEWKIIEQHCEIGFRIAAASPDLAQIAEDILSHHERWDGNGYPQGKEKEEISLLARILAVADAYDAMTNDRCYRKALSETEAIEQLTCNKGTQFDPAVVDCFIDMQRNEASR